MKKHLFPARFLLPALVILAASALPVSADAVPPAQEEPVVLCGDQCIHQTITFDSGSGEVIDRIAVVFMMDVTGSMGPQLEVVKENSVEIMTNLRGLVDESYFGVASFADYPNFFDSDYGEIYGAPGDYPYRLDQDLTQDISDVQAAINRLDLLNGGDWPESSNRALNEMLFAGWPKNVKRIVVLFTDAPSHDPDFYDYSYGIDPGADGETGTGDDLSVAGVAGQLSQAGIAVIGVNTSIEPDTEAFLRFIAQETGGLYFALNNADEIPSAVVDLIEEEIKTINRVTVEASAGYENWITVEPEAFTDVGPDFTGTFEVDICPPADAEEGLHSFDVTVYADGVSKSTIGLSIDYTTRCAGAPDVWVGDHAGDDGTVCSNENGEPFWESTDIVNRVEADDFVEWHQNPQFGEENYLYVQVHNRGDEPLDDATMTLYQGIPSLGLTYPDDWDRIKTVKVNQPIPPGESIWVGPVAWEPLIEGHLCSLVRIEAPQDPIRREGDVPCDNNIAQRNMHALGTDPDAPEPGGQIRFIVVGPPPGSSGVIDIVVILPDVPGDTQIRLVLPRDLFDRWLAAGGWVDGGAVDEGNGEVIIDPGADEATLHDVPLDAGEEADVDMEIDGPEDAEPFSVKVEQRVDGKAVGGNTYYYVPPKDVPKPTGADTGSLGNMGIKNISGIAAVGFGCIALLAVIGMVALVSYMFGRRRR